MAIPGKLLRPSLYRAIPRERLYAFLDAMAETPVTWIAAPAGGGKTTLVAGYLQEREIPAVWLQTDEADRDVSSFFFYLKAAIENLAAAPSPLPLFTPDYLHAFKAFSRRFFEVSAATLPTPTTYVFDNFEEVAPSGELMECLRHGFAVLPAFHRVIILSRVPPPPELSVLKATRRLHVLDWDVLRLTEEETAAVAASAGTDFSETMCRQIHLLCQGWPAGVVLVAAAAQHEPPAVSETSTLADVFAYFSVEIFRALPDETRTMLRRTAFLPEMTAENAAAVSGIVAAPDILSTLSQNHCFTQMYEGGDRPRYRYHPLFRSFLKAEARNTLTADEFSRLLTGSADILLREGQPDEAIPLLAEAEVVPALVATVTELAPVMAAQGRSATLERWLHQIPAETVVEKPWLLYWMGICRLAEPAESRRLLQLALRKFEHGDAIGRLLCWAGIAEGIAYEWHDFIRLDECISELRNLAPLRLPAELETQILAPFVTALLIRSPEELEAWLPRAHASALESGNLQLLVQICTTSCYYRLWMGQVPEAAVALDEIDRVMSMHSVSPLLRILGAFGRALHLSCTDTSLAAALEPVRQGLALAAESGIHLNDHLLLGIGVFSCLNGGDTSAAHRYLEKLDSCVRGHRLHGYSHFHYLKGLVALVEGKAAEALAHAERAVTFCDRTGFTLPSLLCRLLIAEAARCIGDLEAADQALDEADTDLLRKSGYLICIHHLLRAAVAFDRTDDVRGTEALRCGLAVAARRQYFSFFWWWSPSLFARLAVRALEERIEENYVRELVRRRNLSVSPPAVHLEQWPWRLKIHTLGRFALVRDGIPVTFSGKVQRKPLALLKALVAEGGRDVPASRLIDLLWPDAEPHLGQQALETAIHRLRRLLDVEGALLVQEGTLTLNPELCWVDVWAFQRVVAAVEAARQEDPDAVPERLLTRSMQLYSGHFLEAEAADHLFLRQRLKARAVRMLTLLGDHYERTREWDKAAEVYRRGIVLDNCAERFYQRLMIVTTQTGNTTEALSCYDKCRLAFADNGLRPAAETTDIYRRLLNGEIPF